MRDSLTDFRTSGTLLAASLAVLFALAPRPAAAGARLGVEFGPRWGKYIEAPFNGGFPGGPEVHKALLTYGGGLLAEWPWSHGIVVGGALRYDVTGEAEHTFVAQFVSPGGDIALWSDRELRFAQLTLAPALRFGLGHGLRFLVSPDVAFVLKTTLDDQLVPGPTQIFAPPTRATGTIFEQAGSHVTQDVTGDFDRWLLGGALGLSFEHGVGGHLMRLSADYHSQLSDPGKFDTGVSQLIHEGRLALSWLR